jgi:hypothetical protein
LLHDPNRGIPLAGLNVLDIPQVATGKLRQSGLRKSFRDSESPEVFCDRFCNRMLCHLSPFIHHAEKNAKSIASIRA